MSACDIGDRLRAIRLTMDAESFNNHLLLKLNRSQPWSVKLIVLSFRRSAVLEALACGQANIHRRHHRRSRRADGRLVGLRGARLRGPQGAG